MEVSRKYQYGKTLTMTDPLKIDFKTGPVERSEYHVIGEEKDICRKADDYEMISEESFDDIEYWLKYLKEKTASDVKVFLIGNKSDLEESRLITKEQG